MITNKALLSKKFRELCEPIKEFISENYDDHTVVIITKDEGKLCLVELGNGTSMSKGIVKTLDGKEEFVKLYE